MEYYFGDGVYVIDGFYKGSKGIVIERICTLGIDKYYYRVKILKKADDGQILEKEVSIHEDELKKEIE